MATPENTFIGSVHRHLPAQLYHMKNHNMYNGGIADVWYSGTRADLWVEYKFIVTPKRDETVIDITAGKDPALSRLQQDWLKARCKEGRNVGVIVGCKEGGVWLPGLAWATPLKTVEFKNFLRSRSDLAGTILALVQ
jgi:hypothetical protein